MLNNDKTPVILHEGLAVTTSLKVATYFEKRHDHVVRDIEDIIADMIDVEESPSDQDVPKIGGLQKFFIKDKYVGESKHKYKMYYLTEDGFNLLAMGFTGKKALRYKLMFIEEFNRMRERIKELSTVESADYKTQQIIAHQAYLLAYGRMTSVKQLIEYAVNHFDIPRGECDPYFYAKINGAINKALGIPNGARPDANPVTQTQLMMLHREVNTVIINGINIGQHPLLTFDETLRRIEEYSKRFIQYKAPVLLIDVTKQNSHVYRDPDYDFDELD